MSEIDLAAFCGKERAIPHLRRPFSIGDYTYATDGKVLVRVPRRQDIEAPDKAIGVEKIMADALPQDGYAPVVLPADIEPETEDCDACDGRGLEHDCPDCQCQCDLCGGDGTIEKWPSVGIDGVSFDAKYIKRILSLPDVLIATAQAETPTAFRFTGGDGLVMPMRANRKDHVVIRAALALATEGRG